MLNRIALIIMIFASTLLCSCHKSSIDQKLKLAEAAMEQHPDSALAMLRDIDGAALKGELRARHALLLSQALDKNFIDIADDSLINIALSYYRNNDTRPRERMMSFYYKANTRYNAGDYNSAIYNLAIADTLASRLDDDSWRGLSNSLMAFALNKLFDHRRNLEYSVRALEYFRSEGDSTHIYNQMYNVGMAYIQIEEYDSALSMLAQLPVEDTYYGHAICLLETGQTDRYRELISNYPQLETQPRLLCRYADKMAREGNISESECAIDKASRFASTGSDSAKLLNSKAILSYAKGEWKDYSDHVTRLLSNSYSHTAHFRSLYMPDAKARADIFVSDMDKESYRQQHDRLIMWIIAVSVSIAILVLLLIITILANRKKKEAMMRRLAELHNANLLANESFQSRIAKLTTEREQLRKHHIELEGRIASMESERHDAEIQADEEYITQQLDTLHQLYQEYIYTPSDKRSKIKLSDKVKIFSKPRFSNALENIIDNKNGHIVTRLRKAGFRSNDIMLLCYLKSGFSAELISLILGVDTGVIYTRKSRLKSRITVAGFEDVSLP